MFTCLGRYLIQKPNKMKSREMLQIARGREIECGGAMSLVSLAQMSCETCPDQALQGCDVHRDAQWGGLFCHVMRWVSHDMAKQTSPLCVMEMGFSSFKQSAFTLLSF